MWEAFNKYTQNYDLSEIGIYRKKEHSEKVAHLMTYLATEMNWSKDDILICEQIGLLHDIGRFEEWVQLKNYMNKQFDHGKHAVKLLKENDLYKSFGIKDENKEIIFNAIYYHNKLEVPEDKNDKFTKLIRDADKLDIFEIYSTNSDYAINFKGLEVTKKVEENFYNEKSVDHKDVKSLIDYNLASLAMIYDINYDLTLSIMKKREYINKYFSFIKEKELYQKYFDKINDYIERRIKNVR